MRLSGARFVPDSKVLWFLTTGPGPGINSKALGAERVVAD